MKTARRFLAAILVGAGLTFASGPRPAFAEIVFNAELVNDTCIGASTNYDLPLMDISYVSFVAAYSTTTPASDTFTDGTKSTATITVSSFTSLALTKAAVQFNFISASTNAYVGAIVTINGRSFRQGTAKEWSIATTATGTAVNLAAAIDADSTFDAVAVSSTVFATSTVAGAFANAWTVSTSTPTVLSTNSSTMYGGRDAARLAVNGVVFDAGTGFTVGTTSGATAQSISAALMANATLAALFTSTWNAQGVITATANAVGTGAYTLFTSTPAALRLNGSATEGTTTFVQGTESKIDLTTDLINMGRHQWGTGLDVLFTVSGSTAPGGLSAGTTYFVIKNDYDRIKLATTKANAAAGTAIDIGSQLGGQTYTLTPLAMTGNPSFKWQGSNNSTFVDLSVSSVTVSAAGSAAWDFGLLPYKTLRLKYTTPTTGCGQVTATGTGRR